MSLKIRLCNITTPNDFTVYYKESNTLGNPYSGFTQYGGTFDGDTTEIVLSGITINYDSLYFIKIQDLTTNRYIIENIYTHHEDYYEDCLGSCNLEGTSEFATGCEMVGESYELSGCEMVGTAVYELSGCEMIGEANGLNGCEMTGIAVYGPIIVVSVSITPSITKTPTSTITNTVSLTPTATPSVTVTPSTSPCVETPGTPTGGSQCDPPGYPVGYYLEYYNCDGSTYLSYDGPACP